MSKNMQKITLKKSSIEQDKLCTIKIEIQAFSTLFKIDIDVFTEILNENN